MFSQPPDKEQPTKPIPNNPRRRRKRKIKKNKRIAKKDHNHTKRKNSFNITMSSWAETFTSAATWQLKHQVAYWKSKATMLAYENKILHDIIRNNYLKSGSSTVHSPDDIQNVESNVRYSKEVKNDSDSEIEEENEEFEVSEEFIEFLKENAKYKADARREREHMKAQLIDEQKPMECEQSTDQITEFSEDKLKEMYGKDWQRIAALEMSVKCDFMSECDRVKPMYWPNIPFNFN